MFAVVKCQGQQFIVRAKDKITVRNLTAKEGEKYKLEKVMLVQPDSGEAHIGTPLVQGAHVDAKVVKHYRGEKIRVFKMKAKKRYAVRGGHREELTELLIEDIKTGGGSAGNSGGAGTVRGEGSSGGVSKSITSETARKSDSKKEAGEKEVSEMASGQMTLDGSVEEKVEKKARGAKKKQE